MGYKIKLGEDFENDKKGDVITVTSTKLHRLKANKIKFTNRLTSVTGYREFEFEQKVKDEEE